MKKQQKVTWFVSGILCSAILASTVVPSLASMVEQKLTVHTGVQVYVDDMKIDAGDTHGNPDAFIYNGTTYVAVAAVSKSLGKNVIWDGDTKSVYIGKHAGSTLYLLDECPPHQSNRLDFVTQANAKSFSMAGHKYTNGMKTAYYWDEKHPYALFNLNGQYSTLSFIMGHVGDSRSDGRVLIYLDGKLTDEFEIGAEDLPSKVEVDLNYALSMKIVLEGPYASCGIADVQIS